VPSYRKNFFQQILAEDYTCPLRLGPRNVPWSSTGRIWKPGPTFCVPTKDKKRERNTRSLKFRPHEHHNTAAASEVQRTTEVFSSGVKAFFLTIQSCHVPYLVTINQCLQSALIHNSCQASQIPTLPSDRGCKLCSQVYRKQSSSRAYLSLLSSISHNSLRRLRLSLLCTRTSRISPLTRRYIS
jgi:hypothetical protein